MHNIIDLDDKDEFTYTKVDHGYFMKIHKKDPAKNDFIAEWEFVRILAIRNIHSQETRRSRWLKRLNDITILNRLYHKFLC